MTDARERALKLLVLTTTLPAQPEDGTPDFVLRLAQEMAGHGAQVTILAPRTPGSARHETIGNVAILRFPYFPRQWEDLADGAILPNLRAKPSRWFQVVPLVGALWGVGWWVSRRRSVDVIHAHWILPGALAARLQRKPYLVTVHGADAYSLSGGLMRAVKRFALGRAFAVLPVSQAIDRTISGLCTRATVVVPMGTEVELFAAAVDRRQRNPRRVLFVGRLAEKKGVDDLLRAIGTLPGAELHIVGDGPQRDDLQDLARDLAVVGRVRFLGTQPRAGVLRELSAASVIAIPSKTASDGDEDGVPVVLAEAMAARVAVVAADAGGLAEHVVHGRTGWLVRPSRPDELAAALSEVLENPEEAARRAGEAFRWASRHLSTSTAASTYLRVAREAMRSQTGRSQ